MMDRMKESIFNIIGPYFNGGIVLDLFGGSGALTIESLSRGVEYGYIVEKHPDAIKIIKKNIELVNESSNTTILPMDYKVALNHLKNNKQKFDLIFLDPPFKMHIIDEIIMFLLENELMNPSSYIICHYHKNSHIPIKKDDLEIIKNYNLGAKSCYI